MCDGQETCFVYYVDTILGFTFVYGIHLFGNFIVTSSEPIVGFCYYCLLNEIMILGLILDGNKNTALFSPEIALLVEIVQYPKGPACESHLHYWNQVTCHKANLDLIFLLFVNTVYVKFVHMEKLKYL